MLLWHGSRLTNWGGILSQGTALLLVASLVLLASLLRLTHVIVFCPSYGGVCLRFAHCSARGRLT